MSDSVNETYQPLVFDAIKIGLASPEKILEWSRKKNSDGEEIGRASCRERV